MLVAMWPQNLILLSIKEFSLYGALNFYIAISIALQKNFGFPFINRPIRSYVMQKEVLWNGTLKWLKL